MKKEDIETQRIIDKFGIKPSVLKENKVKELSHWDMGRTVRTRDGYDSKTIPEACPENMQLLMDKINELCKEVNSLKRLNNLNK